MIEECLVVKFSLNLGWMYLVLSCKSHSFLTVPLKMFTSVSLPFSPFSIQKNTIFWLDQKKKKKLLYQAISLSCLFLSWSCRDMNSCPLNPGYIQDTTAILPQMFPHIHLVTEKASYPKAQLNEGPPVSRLSPPKPTQPPTSGSQFSPKRMTLLMANLACSKEDSR